MPKLIESERYTKPGIVTYIVPIQEGKSQIPTNTTHSDKPLVGHQYFINRPDNLSLVGIEHSLFKADGSNASFSPREKVDLYVRQPRILGLRIPLLGQVYQVRKHSS